jgi:hypothetical protein
MITPKLLNPTLMYIVFSFNFQPMVDYLSPIMEASVELRATTVEHARVAKWLGAASVGNLSLINKVSYLDLYWSHKQHVNAKAKKDTTVM